MNTLTKAAPQQRCDILLDRGTIRDSKGILIVTNGQKTHYDSGDEHLQAITVNIPTPTAWNYQTGLLKEATDKTEVILLNIGKEIGAIQAVLVYSIYFNCYNGIELTPETGITPKLIVEVDELTDLAEEILSKTFEIHRL